MKDTGRHIGGRFFPGGIRARLFLLIALALLPMVVLLGWIYLERFETRRNQAIHTEIEVAQGVASTFSTWISGIRRQSLAVGDTLLTFSSYTEEKARRTLTFNAAQYSTVRSLSWVDPRGIVLASSEVTLVGRDLSGRPYFQAVQSGREWALSGLMQVGTVTKTPTVAMATAIRERGVLRGIVVAAIEPTELGEILFHQRTAEGAFTLFDSRGTLAYRSPEEPLGWEERVQWPQGDPVLRRALQGATEQAGVAPLPLGGGEWVVARVPVPGTGWVAGAERRKTAAFAPVVEKLAKDTLLAVVSVSAAFLLAWIVARSVAGPLRSLKKDAAAMARGPVVLHDDERSPDEVRSLRDTVASMAADLLARAEELRKTEALFRDQYAELDQIYRYAPVGLFTFDREYRFRRINERMAEINGIPVEEHLGRTMRDIVPDLAPFLEEIYRPVLEKGEPALDIEVRGSIPKEPGVKRYWLCSYFPLFSGQGEITGLIGAVVDVTDRKGAETALRQSEAEFRQLAETLPQLVWVTRPDGYHTYFNQLWFDYTGMSLEKSQGDRWARVLHPDDYERTVETWGRSLDTGEPYSIEYRLRSALGEYRWFLGRATPLRDESGGIVRWFGTCTEIHEQILAMEALRRHAEELHTLAREKERTAAMLDSMLSHAPAGFAFFDREHRYVRINDALCRINGLPSEAHLGRPIREVLPENAQSVDPLLDTIFEEGKSLENIEVQGITPMSPEEDRYWLTGWYPVPLPAGEEPLVGAVVLEITELKRLERRLLEAQAELRQANENLEERVQERTAELRAVNQELEAFTYTVSHDLRAPLRHITSFVELLDAKIGNGLDEDGKRYIQIVGNAGRRMGLLIDDLLTFSRIGRAAIVKRPVPLGKMVEEVRQELAPEARGRRVEWKIGELPTVQADPNLLRTALTNLLYNALKYSRGRDPALVEIGHWQEGGEVVIYVRDNGAGFDMRYADKLYGVFQRLHKAEEFEGTGIGLASVRRIIHRHGGRTWAEGEVDRGASFYFSLPQEEA